MPDSDLDYVKVIGRVGFVVGDTADVGVNPDLIAPDIGTGAAVVFEPLVPFAKVAGAVPPVTIGAATITCPIDREGYLTYGGTLDEAGNLVGGQRSVWLLDLGSTKVNPRIPVDVADYQVRFVKVRFDGQAVTFPTFTCHPLPGVDNDVTMLAPVPTGTGVAMVTGPEGPEGPTGPTGPSGGPVPGGGGVDGSGVLKSGTGAVYSTAALVDTYGLKPTNGARAVGQGELAIDASQQAGATDNAKMQAAIDAAVALGGKRIVLPPATYTWAAGVTLPPVGTERGIEIDLRGTIIDHTGADFAVNFGDGGVTDARRHKVHAGRFRGTASGLGVARFNHTRFCEFSGNEVTGYSAAAARVISLLGGVANYFARIRENRINGGVAGVYLDGGASFGQVGANSNYVRHNHFSGLTVAIDNDSGDANRIEGNEFNGSTTTGVRVRTGSTGVMLLGNQHDGVTNAIAVNAGAVDTYILGDSGGGTFTDLGTGTKNYSKFGKVAAFLVGTVRNPDGNLTLLDSAGSYGVVLRTGDVVVHKRLTAGVDDAIEIGIAGARFSNLRVSRAVQPGQFTTALRPSASASGAGGMVYDTTLGVPIWSDGTTWRNASGTAV